MALTPPWSCLIQMTILDIVIFTDEHIWWIFGAYMAKSHMWEGAREMYNKVKADSRVPQLKKVLEEAWLEWVIL